MNEMKNLVYLAGVLAACGFIAGCRSTQKAQTVKKPGKLTIFSDRDVVPAPYRAPQYVSNPASASNGGHIPQIVVTGDGYSQPPQDGGDSEPMFIPADASAQPTAPAPQYSSDYAKPEDASPKPVQPAANVPAAQKRTYKIVKGDTLSGIGYMYQVSWRDIAAANGLTESSVLHEGQEIVLPDNAAQNPRPRQVKKSTPKPAQPATKAPQVSSKPAAAKPAAKPAAKAATKQVPADGFHTVVAGDSLWKICHEYGLKMDDVRALNPTVNFDSLQPKQRVKLVGAKAAAAKAPEAPKPQAAAPAQPQKAPAIPATPITTPVEKAPAPPAPAPAQPEEEKKPAAKAAEAPLVAPDVPTIEETPEDNDAITPEVNADDNDQPKL